MNSTVIDIQERVRSTRERVEADFSRLGTKIHRFPRGLRDVDQRYIIPSFVSLGPYHHGSSHLLETEELKHTAVHYFCEKFGHSVEEVYSKIVSIADEARSCYAHDAVAKFTVMMLLDGCFLLLYLEMDTGNALMQNRMILSTGPCMLRDIFLLENQLPWLVLEALVGFMTESPVYDFVLSLALFFDVTPHLSALDSNSTRASVDELAEYRPPHLLGLLRYSQIGNMTDEERTSSLTCIAGTSAIELAEMGIKLTAGNKTGLADMSFQRDNCLFGGQLSLTPLFINDITACWLVNMAAYEACVSTTYPSDGFVISSYISTLAMLIDREEDVHELRAKHLVRSFFSNHELLVFFKGLTRHMRLGYRYFAITEKIELYKRESPLAIDVHRFIYNNFKTIVAVLSIVGVLVGIFRTLMSLKQHQP